MTKPPVLVVGDVCLGVVGWSTPPAGSPGQREDWRQADELRMHHLPGGAMLLAAFVRAARQAGLSEQPAGDVAIDAAAVDWETVVAGPRPMPPADLASLFAGPMGVEAFLAMAPRLRREEMPQSIIEAEHFPVTSDPKEKKTLPRVRREHGSSGPRRGDPGLDITYAATGEGRIVAISDAGAQLRHQDSRSWPPGVLNGALDVVYALHRPLPDAQRPNALWDLARGSRSRVAIVDVDDLRAEGTPISHGLSWERTALDIVWHLLNIERLSDLRDCPTLIVRLGLDGALLWRHVTPPSSTPSFSATLVYDPDGIEGAFEAGVPGRMVGYGSAFTAAIVESLAARCARPADVPDITDDVLVEGIRSGLLAARRLLKTGFEEEAGSLRYPGASLYVPPGPNDRRLAHKSVPIVPGAMQPDRGYWRLLDATFEGTGCLQDAVEIVATNGRGTGMLQRAQDLLDASPRARFGALVTYDRREIEHYRSLSTLLRDYLQAPNPVRPLSVAVFGAPGAGKSFGVKEVAKSLRGQPGCRDIETLTFNLALYHAPDDLAGAFHLVRDVGLRGKVPLVFFDEFDTSLEGVPLGWLRHFLAPMQDGEFLDREAPHPIGPAIFVFAGGTCSTFARFGEHAGMTPEQFAATKGPDFISRLRATLDVPSLNLSVAFHRPSASDGGVMQELAALLDAHGIETFDPYGPGEEIPSRAAVLLRRAAILAFNLSKKAPGLVRADKSLAISPPVLRALLHLPQFRHGNRSFEALLDMSHLLGATTYTPALLPPAFQTGLHADAAHLSQLVATDYPFPAEDRERIGRAIHQQWLEDTRTSPVKTRAHRDWNELDPDDRHSNLEQADDIAAKLRTAGLWFRKRSGDEAGGDGVQAGAIDGSVEILAMLEHDRWAAQRRRQGWAPAASTDRMARKDDLLLHNCLFPWDALTEQWRDLDRHTVRRIPAFLAAAGYEVIKPER